MVIHYILTIQYSMHSQHHMVLKGACKIKARPENSLTVMRILGCAERLGATETEPFVTQSWEVLVHHGSLWYINMYHTII